MLWLGNHGSGGPGLKTWITELEYTGELNLEPGGMARGGRIQVAGVKHRAFDRSEPGAEWEVRGVATRLPVLNTGLLTLIEPGHQVRCPSYQHRYWVLTLCSVIVH